MRVRARDLCVCLCHVCMWVWVCAREYVCVCVLCIRARSAEISLHGQPASSMDKQHCYVLRLRCQKDHYSLVQADLYLSVSRRVHSPLLCTKPRLVNEYLTTSQPRRSSVRGETQTLLSTSLIHYARHPALSSEQG